MEIGVRKIAETGDKPDQNKKQSRFVRGKLVDDARKDFVVQLQQALLKEQEKEG